MPTDINGYSPTKESPLSSLVINEVESKEVLEMMKNKNVLQENQLYLVPEEDGGDSDTAKAIIETNKGLEQKFWRGTKEEFNAVGTKSDDTMYIITDEEGSSVVGSGVAIGDEEPTDGATVWIDTDAELSGGGGVDIPASDTEPATGNYWLDTSAEGGTYYTAGETLSASTKTALGIAEDATPDIAFAEISQQLSESGVKLVKLWENASPTSAFSANTVTVNMSGYEFFIVKFCITTEHPEEDIFSPIMSKCSDYSIEVVTGTWDSISSYRRRSFNTRDNKLNCGNGYEGNTLNNNQIIPLVVYGLKGVTA